MRQCPFTNCARSIPSHLFACGPHWHRLTRQQQATVYAIYNQWKRGELSGPELLSLQQGVVEEAEGVK